MVTGKTAKRYAKALFSLCRENNQIDEVLGELQDLRKLVANCPELDAFLKNPAIKPERRAAVLRELFGSGASPSTYRFLQVLNEKKRLDRLEAIVAAFEDLFYHEKGILRAKVTSAAEMDEAQVGALRDRLEKRTGCKIEAAVEVDPGLIGGFKIQVGDFVRDFSIATQLESLKQDLIKA